ncbi:CRE-SRT-39 protein [Aphelenchoides avenae]|nr:CRE-SRT-39 protein [Aphelenchus avenae]
MDLVLFHYDEWYQLYNCSWYDVDSLPLETREHEIGGWLAMVLTVIFEVLYIPCFFVITRPEYFKQSCFKLMALIGFLDITLMPFSGFVSGYFAVKGDMYCSYPTFIYASCTVVNGLWGAHMITSFILALNRCLLILKPRLAHWLFDGKRTYVWFLIPLAMATAMIWHFKPLLANGLVMAWVANPHIGYLADDGTLVRAVY